MRPTKYFIKLREKTEIRLRKYQALVYKSNNPFHWPESDQILSYVVIQCLNLWSVFFRTYFLSCALSPLRENGSRVTCNSSIKTFDDAIDRAIKATRRSKWEPGKTGKWTRLDEPSWGNPSNFMNSCKAIVDCSNYQEIQNAFSIQTGVFEVLPKFRHFYAHRNEDTAKKALDIARQHYSIPIIPKNNHPTKMLLQTAYGRPQSCLILDWIDDIINTVDLLCK